MNKNKFKYLLGVMATLCIVYVLMPTTALANGPEVYDGDIHVDGGYYTISNGSSEEPVFYPVDEENPIRGTGEPINRNIYVSDNTDLYFDELDLGTGGIYATNKSRPLQWLSIKGGNLRAKEIKSNHTIYLPSNSHIYIEENVTGAILNNYADLLDVGGDIIVPRIFFSFGIYSKELYVRVGGNVECHSLFSDNTSIYIEGDLSVSDYETNYEDTLEEEGNYLVFQGAPEFNLFPELHVKGNIMSVDDVEMSYSTIFSNSIRCDKDSLFIDDSATLFNAINKNSVVIPSNFSEPPLNLYRTTLSGLIPNREANIVISYDDHDDYTKEFTATANAEGQVFVWLVGNKNLSGTATYAGEDPITLTAEASASSGVVENLEFPYDPDNDTPTSENDESSSTEISTPDTDTKEDDSDNTKETTDSNKTIKADTPKTSDNNLMALWFILSVTTLFAIAGSIIKQRKLNGQES